MLQCKTKWEKKKLKDICSNIFAGGTPSTNITAYWENGQIIWLPSGLIQDCVIDKSDAVQRITELGLARSSAKIIKENTTLLAMTGATCGKTAFLTFPAAANQSVMAFETSEINPQILYYLFQKNKEYILKFQAGGAQAGINKSTCSNFEFYFPNDKEEQDKIVNILSTCDEVIEKTEETIEKYKQIKAGMMQDLFTRGLDANGKLRPTYTQNPDLYKYSKELDRYIPKEWDTDKLDSEKVAVINPPCGKLPDEFIYIDLESVINGNLEQIKIISRVGAPSRAQRLVEDYDILYQTVRPYQKNNYLYIQTTNMKSVASTGYAQIRTILSPTFLYQYLHTDLFVNKVLCLCTGTSYPAINPTNLGKLYIPIPKTEEQKHIANLFKTIDMKINKENEVLSKYKQIKQGLMKRLLTPPADAEIVEE